MKSATLWEHLPKSCLLLCLVAAGVCAVMLIPSEHGTSEPVRKQLIPRYQFEKEVRGPNYHVVHRVFDNDGYESVVRTKAPYGQMVAHEKFKLRKRRALPDAQSSQTKEAMQHSPADPKLSRQT